MDDEAQRRHDLHKDHPTHRPLSYRYERVGIAGEEELCRFFGIPYEPKLLPGGDRGIDIELTLMTRAGRAAKFKIDVKAARIPKHLWVEVGHCAAHTVYVLAGYDDISDMAALLGWEWGAVLLKAEQVLSPDGVLNHSIKRGKLRKLSELKARVIDGN